MHSFQNFLSYISIHIKIIDDWKNKYVCAILMDLSKAFDCLPHNLLLLKLKYYGLSENALSLIKKTN